ncbi:MAG TPA: helix-turn-helix domain-containing protein [Gemmataceae bacterium]|jgi:excisionase family DNA binding protein|nr:helix-turn-helix domain-containing protein [Gemmataceae bacterium]
MNDDDLVRLTTRFYQALKALAGNDVTQFNYFLEELREQGVYVALSDWKVLERPPKPTLLSAPKMAARLGVDRKTLLGWYRAGTVPGARPGRTYLFEPAKVHDALWKAGLRPRTAGEEPTDP